MPFFEANDATKLYFEDYGGIGPMLIFIHGWTGSSKVFSRNFLHFVNSFRVIAVDLRGHGKSDKPAHGRHVHRLAMDLRNLLQHLDLLSTKVHLVGASLGSAVIWAYVELFSADGLASAVFVDQAPLQNAAMDGSWTCGSKGIFGAESLGFTLGLLRAHPVKFLKGVAEGCLTAQPTQEEYEFFGGEGAKADPQFCAELMVDHTQLDWRATLPLVRCPSFVMCGGKSRVFPVDGCLYAAKHLPDSCSMVFPHSGHWLYWEEYEKFNVSLECFLNDVISK